jgi:hypothetical protein
MSQYRHNHYVPIWYQERFMLPGQSRYYRLDLKPDVVERDGHKYTRKDLHHWSPEKVFAQDDLYTTQWGRFINTDIEQFFFGRVDSEAKKAVEFFTNYDYSRFDEPAFHRFLGYMSIQKLRTPKGLAAFAELANVRNKNATLSLLQKMQHIHCAIWTECVWQIADAFDCGIPGTP